MNTLALDPYLRLSSSWGGPHDPPTPWRAFDPSSGAVRAVSRSTSPESGISCWLERIIGLSGPESENELTTHEVPGALTEIRDAFSLNTVQLAEVLGVSRQAIYDWTAGKTVALENRRRIGAIRDLARRWRDLHHEPMGSIVSESVGGSSLLDLLKADRLDPVAVTAQLAAIAARLREIQEDRPLSARELAARHGMRPLAEENHRRNLQQARLRHRRHG